MAGTATLSNEALLEEWSAFASEQRLQAFQAIRRDRSDDIFLALGSREQLDLLLALPEGERRRWPRLLASDDAADLIQLASESVRSFLIDQLDDVAGREVNALLAFKQDAAGGLMSPRFTRLRPEMTADEAISYLRRQVGQVETIYYAYAQHLLGVVCSGRRLGSHMGSTL